ncbi:opioid-binding protein/cell adhesion molecule homolog isoform X2 [Pomacea canaliculata]|uniref:opioid-binding protein/cell adhesion molecule homolog isoform X2 n=1 Tax=Pomacea canaliculata TaxID=400727 RepID=UPI000D73A4C0|nr:opioid-binding protein/cell adhesion molecule homolog isoform X2 [Pomacea canaliculata]
MRQTWTYAFIICCLVVHAERTFPVSPAVYGDGDKASDRDEGASIDLEDVTPSFDSPMANVTVKEGATAVLPCSVKFLGRRQVVWTDQWSTLLTFEDRRIIDDERLSVERPFSKDWNLHIRNVQHKDQGLYNCQINTSPVKIKTVHLKVQVPAKIIENLSSSDTTVREGETVTLVCNVTGIPLPRVTWYRHVSDKKGQERERIGVSGEVLIIHNISRYCGDVYECVAFNDVPPAINRMIKVDVQFSPEIELPNKRIGQMLGKETILECIVTANPQSVSRWLKDGEEVKTDGSNYHVEVYNEHQEAYTIVLSFRIMAISEQDFGQYTCEASSPMGKDAETMVLFEYKKPQTTTTSTTTTTAAPILSTIDVPRRGFPSQGQQDPSQAQIRIFTQGPPRHTLAPPPGAQQGSPDDDVIDGGVRGRSRGTAAGPVVETIVMSLLLVFGRCLVGGS